MMLIVDVTSTKFQLNSSTSILSRQICLPKTDDLVPVLAAYVIISCTQQEGMRGERAYIHLPNRLLAALDLVRPGYDGTSLRQVGLSSTGRAVDSGVVDVQRFDASTEQPEPGVVPMTPLGETGLYG